jgi:hypothetical protein
MPATPAVTSVVPDRAVGRGRVTLNGSGFAVDGLSDVFLGDAPARISFASSRRLVVTIPDEMDGGLAAVRVGDLTLAHVSIGAAWATGLHQVDNPAFDRDGNLFVTYSGSRGQEAPVSIFRVTPAGTREPFSSGIVNATSMAFGPDGRLYVSSRFEGAVYRIAGDGTPEQVASDLGVACGIAFDADGWMYVGDRSGRLSCARGVPWHSRHYRRASQRFTWPEPGGGLHVTARRWAPTIRSTVSIGTARSPPSLRPWGGRRGSRSAPTVCSTLSTRWRDRAASIA